MEPEPGRLSVGEFAFPGPLRDQLVAAIVAGAKTTTTGLLADYELDAEPLPRPGDRQVVIDSAGIPVALIEIADVRVVGIGDIGLSHAAGEGEGYASVAEWRSGHERFWHSPEYRRYRGDPAFTVNDGTLAVAQRFRVVPADHHDLGSLLRRAREADQERARLPRFLADVPRRTARRRSRCRGARQDADAATTTALIPAVRCAIQGRCTWRGYGHSGSICAAAAAQPSAHADERA